MYAQAVYRTQPGPKHVPTTTREIAQTSPGRGEAENFVSSVFARSYAARVTHFAPDLMLLEQAGRIAACLRGEVGQQTYLEFLHQAFHHVRHMTPLLMAVGSRLPERLDWLRKPIAEDIEGEIGHEAWILNDIAAADGDAAAAHGRQPV